MEKEIYGIIYLIRNKINNKVYIGQTTQDGGFDRRYHTKDGIKDTHNEHLRNSINKYGIENFYINKEFDIAYSKEELDKLEDMYIKIYNTTDDRYGYNKQDGGANGKMSNETKEKLRQAKSKSIICLNTNEVFNSAKEAGEYYNIENTNITKCLKGRRNSKFAGRLKDGTPLVWLYYEDYINMTKEEIANKINEACNSKVANRISKKVICITTEEIFDNAKQAELKYNINHVASCCLGKRKSSGKINGNIPLKWMYYEDYIKL